MLLRLSVSLTFFFVLISGSHSASLSGDSRVRREIPSKPLLVTYWGQNGAHKTFKQREQWEKPLEWFCKESDYDIIVLGFIVTLSHSVNKKDQLPGLNFAYHPFSDNTCSGGVTSNHPQLFRCKGIEDAIHLCQNNKKKVLLSVGGATMFVDFGNKDNAVKHANDLWQLFLGGKDKPNLRPFDSATLDGIDFNLEAGMPNFVPDAIRELRRLMNTDPNGKKYLITTAPQCPIPDRMLGPGTKGTALEETGHLTDYVFVQFYNNYCHTGAGKDFDTVLDKWLSFSREKNVGLMIGLVAHEQVSQSIYYRSVEDVRKLWQQISGKRGVSGIMLWDSSWDQNNKINGMMYSKHLKQILDGTPNQSPLPPKNTQPTQASTLKPATLSTMKTTLPKTPISQVPDDLCSNMQFRSFPHPTDCSKYIECAFNGLHIRKCPAGLHFHKFKQVCLWPHEVQCVTTPSPGEKPTKTSPPKLTTKATTKASSIGTPTSPVSDNICKGKSLGSYLPHPSNCKKYIRCVHGIKIVNMCPKGLLFDKVLAICNWAQNVQC